MTSPYKNSTRTDLIFLMCFFLGTFILTMEILEDNNFEKHFNLKHNYGSIATGLQRKDNSYELTPAPHLRNVMSQKKESHTTYSTELSIPQNLTDMRNDVGGVFSSWALRPLSDEEIENFEDMYINDKGNERRTIPKLLQSWGQLPIISEDIKKDNNSLTDNYQKLHKITDKDTAYRIAMELEEQLIKNDNDNGMKNEHTQPSGVGLDFALSGDFDETEDQNNNDKISQVEGRDDDAIINDKNKLFKLDKSYKNIRSREHILQSTHSKKFKEIPKQNIPDTIDNKNFNPSTLSNQVYNHHISKLENHVVDKHRSRSLGRHRMIQQGIWEVEEPLVIK